MSGSSATGFAASGGKLMERERVARRMSHEEHKARAPSRVRFALVTVSDSRTRETDASGDLLAQLVEAAGHVVAHRTLVPDDEEDIARAFDDALQAADALVMTGGTGISPRDVTPDALEGRIHRPLPGFGELFRMLSWQEIGSAAMTSRAEAGIAQERPVFLLPGSPKACRLAMEKLILPEIGHLVGLLRR